MQKMLEEKQVYENKFTDIYMNYFVYITYTSKIEDTVTVRTIPTGFRLKTLLSCDVSSSDIDENIIKEINTQVISYIPEVCLYPFYHQSLKPFSTSASSKYKTPSSKSLINTSFLLSLVKKINSFIYDFCALSRPMS